MASSLAEDVDIDQPCVLNQALYELLGEPVIALISCKALDRRLVPLSILVAYLNLKRLPLLEPGVFCVVPSELLKLCNVFLKLSNDVGFGSYVVPDCSFQQFLTLIDGQLELRTVFDLKLVKFNAERHLTHRLVKDGLELLIGEQSVVCYVQSIALGVQNFELLIHLL